MTQVCVTEVEFEMSFGLSVGIIKLHMIDLDAKDWVTTWYWSPGDLQTFGPFDNRTECAIDFREYAEQRMVATAEGR